MKMQILLKKLKMSSAVMQALEDERLDKVLVNTEWNARFYSLLEDKNVPQILEDLKHVQRILEYQRREAIFNKVPQIIWDYMFLNHHDFEFVKPEPLKFFRYSNLKLVKLKDNGKHWVFYFSAFRPDSLRVSPVFRSGVKWINDIPDVERFIITLMYPPNSVSSYELARVKKDLCRIFFIKTEDLPPDTQFSLLHINSITGEKMEEIGLNSLADSEMD